jgi:hypothetical protein
MGCLVKFAPSIVYRPNECTRCPGCTKMNWYIGRVTAECAFCGWTLPLLEQAPIGNPEFYQRGKRLAA